MKKSTKKAAKKVTQRATLTSELKDIGTMLAQIGMGVNEVRSMVAAPPVSSGAVAHSVEVSKRLDELRYQTKQAVNGLKDLINTHVAAYEKRLAELEFQFPMLLNRVKELEAKLASKPKRK